MDRLHEVSMGSCVASCKDKHWLQIAEQLLRNNRINKYVFAEAVSELLSKGRGENRNLLVVGPANCGKTFLFNPLTVIYNSFSNPSGAKYAFVGVQDCEINVFK